ncbi:aldehyde dehydrogenase family protein [Malacoplasma muris]|uniref:aldehyde dehydrogenase family protein n=1 Tax=Malacoplasma muris TaxID=2119 RepID=UPI00398E9418
MGMFLNKLDKQKIFIKKGFFTIKERLKLLNELKNKILENKENIYDALYKDFNKSKKEIDLVELNPVINELNYFIKNIYKLSKNKKLYKGFKDLFNSKSYIKPQCYGSILLFVSNDLPFNIAFIPIIGAIAAGNTVFIKFPEHAKNTNKISKKILGSVFDDHHIFFIDNELDENDTKELFQLDFDMVFFFGKTKNAKNIVKNYTSRFIEVVFQIGSKCPIVIDETANIDLASKRIIWSKAINSGQLSSSPDYILIHETVYNDFVQAIRRNYNELFYKVDYKTRFCKIITDENLNRMINIIDKNKKEIVFGGNYDKNSKSIEFTLMNVVDLKSEMMNNENFGPILPIIKYNNVSDVFGVIDHNPSPLAIYVFSKNKNFWYEVQQNIETRILIFNDVMTQMFYNVPQGGIRTTGSHAYGKKYSWDLFTYNRVIIKSSRFSWKNRYRLITNSNGNNFTK